MSSVFRYCLHRALDNAEVVVPLPEVESYLVGRAVARWKSTPLRSRYTEKAVMAAIQGAFEDAHEALRMASLRA